MKNLFLQAAALVAIAYGASANADCAGQYRFIYNGNDYGTMQLYMVSATQFQGSVSGFYPDSAVYGDCSNGYVTINRLINRGTRYEQVQVYRGTQYGGGFGNYGSGTMTSGRSGQATPFDIRQLQSYSRFDCSGLWEITSSYFGGSNLEIRYVSQRGEFSGVMYNQNVSGYCSAGQITVQRVINQGSRYEDVQTFRANLYGGGGRGGRMEGQASMGGYWSADPY